MNKSEIKKTVLAEIEKTKAAIHHYKDLTQAIAPDDTIGRISRMDAINNKSVNEASLRQAEQKLKSLNTVLNKLGDSDFGICLKCKNPIPIGRIMIRPESLLCVNCAT